MPSGEGDFAMRLSALVVLLVLAAGCNRDKIDSRNDPPVKTTTAGASDTAATAAPSDTSTTTRPAETAHPPSNTTT
jgi:hypothetical protein